MTNTMLKSIAKYCEMVSTDEDVDMGILVPYIQNDMKEDWKEARCQWNWFIIQTTCQNPFKEIVKDATKNKVTQTVVNELCKFHGCENHDLLNHNSYFLREYTVNDLMSFVYDVKLFDHLRDSDLKYEIHLKKVRHWNENGYLMTHTGGIRNTDNRFDAFIAKDLLKQKSKEN